MRAPAAVAGVAAAAAAAAGALAFFRPSSVFSYRQHNLWQTATVLAVAREGDSSSRAVRLRLAFGGALPPLGVPPVLALRPHSSIPDELDWGNEYSAFNLNPISRTDTNPRSSSLDVVVRPTGRRGFADALAGSAVGAAVEARASDGRMGTSGSARGEGRFDWELRLREELQLAAAAEEPATIVMLASGTGVVPMVSMLQHSFSDRCSAETCARGKAVRFIVICCARSAGEFLLEEELRALAREPQVAVFQILPSPADGKFFSDHAALAPLVQSTQGRDLSKALVLVCCSRDIASQAIGNRELSAGLFNRFGCSHAKIHFL